METKPFWASLTFWGAVLAVVAPFVLQWTGVVLDEQGWAQDIVTAIGGVMVLLGRWRATQPLRLL